MAREQVVDFARDSYMHGSTYADAAALLTSADPAQLIERAALLEAAGSHRSDVLDQVTVVEDGGRPRRRRRAHRGGRGRSQLKADAAAALEFAQAAEVSARQQAAAVAEQQESLQAELARRSATCADLVGAQEAARAGHARAAAPAPSAPPAGPPPATGNQTPAGPGSSSAAQTAIDAAMGYLGLPYAWGGGGTYGPGPGLDPDAGVIGFDCSGLTQYAYAQAGISIPRNSRAQYAAAAEGVGRQTCSRATWCSGRATRPTRRPSTTSRSTWATGRSCRRRESGDVVKVSSMWWSGYAGAVRPSS